MQINNRLTKLEKKRNEEPPLRVRTIEIYGSRMDGTKYLMSKAELKDGQWITVYKNSDNKQEQIENDNNN